MIILNSLKSSPNQILIAVVVAVAVFTIGLIGITLGLRTLNQRTEPPLPTSDIAALPLTPLPAATRPPAVDTLTPLPDTTLTPTPTETPTETPTPTPTETSTPEPILEPTATLPPTPYAGPLRNNGGDYTSVRREGIVVDGELGDWGGVAAIQLPFIQQGAENYTGNADLSVSARLAWDDTFLFVAADVSDDQHVQALRGYDLYNGDELELWLDTDLAGDFGSNSTSEDDWQFGFSPGDFASNEPEAVIWFPQRREDWNAQVLVVAQPQGQGYRLEAAIPWALIGVQPVAGMVFGFALNASDNDVPDTAAQQTIIMTNPNMIWGQPLTFGNLRFGG